MQLPPKKRSSKLLHQLKNGKAAELEKIPEIQKRGAQHYKKSKNTGGWEQDFTTRPSGHCHYNTAQKQRGGKKSSLAYNWSCRRRLSPFLKDELTITKSVLTNMKMPSGKRNLVKSAATLGAGNQGTKKTLVITGNISYSNLPRRSWTK